MAERGSTRSPDGGVRASFSLLRRNGDFRKVYLSSAISLGGDWFLLVALFGLVVELTDSALAVAFLLAAQDLTYFVVSPFTGVLADRLDRKRLMVVADIARAVLCLGFLAVQTASVLWVVYPLLAVMACFSAAFEPASAAALPNLVEDDDLATANALSGSLWGTMLVVGAAVGGVVTAILGRDTAIVIDAVSFVGSALLLVRIRRSFQEDRGAEKPVPLGEAARETIHYARRDHRVLALLAVKFGWGLAGGVLVLVPLLADGRFEAGDVGIGLLAGRQRAGRAGRTVRRPRLARGERPTPVPDDRRGARRVRSGLRVARHRSEPPAGASGRGARAHRRRCPMDALVVRAAEDRPRPHPRPHLRVRRDAGDAHVRHVQPAHGLARGGLRPPASRR